MFKVKYNPILGKMEWEQVEDDYDYHQEVARSAYADMLHDSERNEKYHVAVKAAVQRMHSIGKPAHVLDIGTGTGLLAMMAASCGADSVVACEAFQPMAKCANAVLRDNNLAAKIKVIPKRSTEIVVGVGGDMDHRANILVTEVFDTELIGEGAISTFNHAHKELLEQNSIVIPSKATIYAQVVECPQALAWHRPVPWISDDKQAVVLPPDEALECTGASAVHDIQLSQLSEENFRDILPPTPVFRFDWSGQSGPIPCDGSELIEVKAVASGIAQVVFMWWDLQMDVDGQVMLSCAPYWAHPTTEKEKGINPQENGLPWRDHWMQALYYLPSEVSLKEGEVATLRANHDEYSLWFDLQKGSTPGSVSVKTEHPVCKCGLHASFGRARIGALNDESRRLKYASALGNSLKRICDAGNGDGGQVTVLCLSEGSLLGIFMAKMAERMCSGKKIKVFCVDGNSRSKKVLDAYVQRNQLSESVTVLEDVSNLDHLGGFKVNVLLGEPHFYSALLPWHNMHIWYRKNELRPLLHPDALLMPKGATIWAMAVVFTDLWKIRAPVHSAEGFKMESFDKLIEASRSIGDEQVEPQPLWEYPCRALSAPVKLFDFDFQQSIPSDPLVERGIFGTESEFSECNGIALWVDWDLDGKPEHVISTGPVGASPTPGKFVSWDIHTRQGVRLIETTSLPINYEARFLPSNCDLSLCIQERSEQ